MKSYKAFFFFNKTVMIVSIASYYAVTINNKYVKYVDYIILSSNSFV